RTRSELRIHRSHGAGLDGTRRDVLLILGLLVYKVLPGRGGELPAAAFGAEEPGLPFMLMAIGRALRDLHPADRIAQAFVRIRAMTMVVVGATVRVTAASAVIRVRNRRGLGRVPFGVRGELPAAAL